MERLGTEGAAQPDQLGWATRPPPGSTSPSLALFPTLALRSPSKPECHHRPPWEGREVLSPPKQGWLFQLSAPWGAPKSPCPDP